MKELRLIYEDDDGVEITHARSYDQDEAWYELMRDFFYFLNACGYIITPEMIEEYMGVMEGTPADAGLYNPEEEDDYYPQYEMFEIDIEVDDD